MPRSTHPVSDKQHSRAQVREQRQRLIKKRWRRNKDLYRVEEGSGALVVDMNSRRVRTSCAPEMLTELSEFLAQPGPLLFLDPEALRRAPVELRRSVEKCLGLKVLGRNELARNSSSHDRVLAAAVDSHHAENPKRERERQKRKWHREVDVDAAEIGI